MIELRWTLPDGTTTDRPRLQYRLAIAVDANGAFCPNPPGAWKDVPTVIVPRRDFKQNCCAGGPQWGHAWDCPSLP